MAPNRRAWLDRTSAPPGGSLGLLRRLGFAALAAACWCVVPTFGQTSIYLDVNNTTTGSGVTNGSSQTWDDGTTINWSANSAGTAATGNWTSAVAGAKNATFSAGTDAGAAYTVNVSGTISNVGGLTFQEGNVTVTGGTALSLVNTSTVNVASGLTGTINTVIDGNGYGLTKTGAGTLVLSGANTFTGDTTISAGTLRATTSTQALGTGSANVVLNGGTLQLADNTGLNFGRNTTVSATSTIQSDRTNTGAGTTQTLGSLTMGASTLNVSATANRTSGTAGITFGGVLLNATGGTFAPATNTLLTVGNVVGTNTAFTVNGAGNMTVSGIVDTGTGGITKSGTGTLTLSGVNTFTGTTTVSGGTLSATTSAQALGIGAASVTLSGGTLQLADNTGLNFGRDVTVSSTSTIQSDRTSSGAGTTQSLDALTMGASTLNLAAGGNVTSGTAGLTFNSVTLNATGATFTPAASTQLTLGSVNGTNTSFTVNGAGNTVISGNITTGTGGISKSSTGMLTLSGQNTFTGTTTISAGTVRATTNAQALGTGTANVTLSGGTLQLADNTGLNFARNVTVSSTSTIQSDRTSAGAGATQTLGTLTMGASTLNVAGGANVTSGTAGITFGPVTLNATGGTFSVANPAGGGTTLLTLGNVTGTNTSFTVGGTGNTTISGVVATGSGGITKSGTGQLTLSGANTFTGTTTISGGTVRATTSTQALGTGAATVTLSGGTLQLADNTGLNFARNTKVGATSTIQSDRTSVGAGTTQTLGTLTMGASTLNIGAGANVTSGTAGITFGAATLNATSGATFAPGANTQLNLASIGTSVTNSSFTVSGAGNMTVSGVIATGTGGITKSSTGVLTLSGVNTFTGAVALSAGTLRATTSTGALGAGTLTISGTGALELGDNAGAGVNFGRNTIITAGTTPTITSDRNTAGGGVIATLGTLTMGASTLNVAAGANVTSGTAGLTFSGAATLNGTTATFAPAANTNLTLGSTVGGSNTAITVNGAGNMTITGAITDGTGSIVKSGNGTLTLSAANTYSGGTTLNAGTLIVGNNSTLSSGTLTVNGGVLDVTATRNMTNALTLGSGATLTYGGSNNLNLSGTVTLAGANTFNITANTVTINSVVGGGTASLTKTGAGTLSLAPAGTNNSTYTGGTTVNGGTLALSFAGMTAANPANVINSGTLVLGGGTLALTGKGSGTSSQTFSGLNLNSGASAISVNSNGGTATNFTVASSGLTGGLARTAGSGATLDVTLPAAGTVTINRTASGSAGILGGWATANGGATWAVATGNVITALSSFSTTWTATNTNNTDVGTGLTAPNNAATNSIRFANNGSRTLALTGTNTITSGGILVANNVNNRADTISGGTLVGSATDGLIVQQYGIGTTSLAISSIIANNGAVNSPLTKSGPGTLTLSGANTYTGTTFLNAGTLRATTSAQALGTGASALQINGGTLQLADDTAGNGVNYARNTTVAADATIASDRTTAASAGTTQTLGTLSIGAQTLAVTGGSNVTSGTAGVTFGDATLSASGTTFNITKPAGGGATLLTLANVSGSGNSFNVTGNGSMTVTGNINTGTGGITSNSTGTLTLANANAYSGNTTFSTGTLAIGDTNALQNSTLDTSGAVNATFVNGITAATLGGLNGNNTTSISLQNNAAAAVALSVGNDNANTAYSGVLTGTGSLTKVGTGQLTLSGASNYTGDTMVSAGTLTVASSGSLSSSTDLIVNGGTINLNNAAQTVNSLSGSGGTVNLGSGHVLTDTSTGTDSFDGTITGFGGFTKSGTGTLTLSASNNQTGVTTLSAGTTTVSSGASLTGATGNLVVNTGAVLNLNNSAQTVANLSGTGGTINLGANHNLTVNGTANSTWTGNIVLNGDATIGTGSNLLVLGNGTAGNYNNTINLGANDITFATGALPTTAPLYLGGNVSYILDPANIYVNSKITGTGGVNKTGPGTLILYAGGVGNDFSGTLNITGGSVIVDSDNVGGVPAAVQTGNIVIGTAGNTGAANSVSLQIGPSGFPDNNIVGVYNATTGASATNLTIYEDGVLKMNNNSNGFDLLTLQGGHVNGGGSGNPVLALTGGVTTLTSSQTALIDGGFMAMTSGNFVFNVAPGASSGVDLSVASVLNNGLGFTGNSGDIITKNGTGKLVLSGTNSFDGVTHVDAGILNIQNNAALGSAGTTISDNTNGTIVQSAGQLQLQGGITVTHEVLTLNGNYTGSSGDAAGALLNYAGDNTWIGQINIGSNARINAAANTTLTIQNPSIGASIIDNNGGDQTLTFGGSGNVTITGGISNSLGNLAVAKDGSGTLTLNGVNTYESGLSISSGYVKVTNNGGLSGSTDVTSGSSLQLSGGVTVAPANRLSGKTLTLRGDGVGGDTTNFTGPSAALENLAGNNTFNGAIALGADASIKTTRASDTLTFDTGASVDLASASHNALVVGGAGNVTFTGIATINNGDATAVASTTPTGNTGTQTYSVITTAPGTGGTLKKIDSGTLTFAGSGTSHVDNIALNGGSLVVGGTATLLSGPLSVASGTTLTINSGTALGGGLVTFSNTALGPSTISGNLTGTGTLQFDATTAGGGKLVFNHTISPTSMTLLVTGGEIDLTGAGTTVTFGTIHLAGNTILDFGGSAGTTLSSSSLIIDAGVSVTVNNWVGETDFWMLTGAPGSFTQPNSPSVSVGQNVFDSTGNSPQGRITFAGSGYGPSSTVWVSWGTSGPYTNNEIRPIPEPATYGVLFFSGCLALLGWRRYTRRSSIRQE